MATDLDPLATDIRSGLEYILHHITTNHIAFDTATIIASLDPSHASNGNHILQQLSQALLVPNLTTAVYIAFEPLVIDLVARWRPTTDHDILERMTAAFAVILPLKPELLPHAFYIFKESPSLFIRLEQMLAEGLMRASSSDTTTYLQSLLLNALRLLFYRKDKFRSTWNWTPLYRLLHHPDRAIRYLSLRCLAYVNPWSEKTLLAAVAKWVPDPNEAVMLQVDGKQHDLIFLSLVEQHRIAEIQKAIDQREYYLLEPIISNADLSSLTLNLGGILTIRKAGTEHNPPVSTSGNIVYTPSTLHTLRSIAKALITSKPILLHGPIGCGKTSLVDHISNLMQGHDAIKIHLGDQSDAKVLLGTYVSSSTPGSFEWQEGVLSTAVKTGRWVLIEDVDLAPTDVQSVLIPLLEERRLFIPSRGENILAHDDFMLFATRSASKSRGRDMLGEALYSAIEMPHLSVDELGLILEARFPKLSPIVTELLEMYDSVLGTQSKSSRIITSRDLMKWCTRINVAVVEPVNWLSSGVREIVLREAIDVLFGANAAYASWRPTIHALGDKLGYETERIDVLVESYRPQISATDGVITIGRVNLQQQFAKSTRRPFAMTGHSLRLLERIGVAVQMTEPILMVGETGTGKTTVVQQLASMLGQKLNVVNLSQQSESSDLLGGFKPVDASAFAGPLYETFEELFGRTFSIDKNVKFIQAARRHYQKKDWSKFIQLLKEACKMAQKKLASAPTAKGTDSPRKRRKVDDTSLHFDWSTFSDAIASFEVQHQQMRGKFVFKFITGTLVKAMERGEWILLDEINLASPETLECLSGVLQGATSSLTLVERGDVDPIKRHENFRVFACMNPATDIGKRDLPPGLRSRFTEMYVHPPDSNPDDVLAIVKQFIGHCLGNDERAAMDVVDFYLEAKRLALDHRLADGANQRPHFSMRTLSRALTYVADTAAIYGLRRALYEGFSMTFLTMLDQQSLAVLRPLVIKHMLNRVSNPEGLLRQLPKQPADNFIQFAQFWLETGPNAGVDDPRYIMTPSVETNLYNLARVVMTRKYPVLIQGPTSSGKTSMVEYLANRTGHRFVRINNHEHTDLQEYLGSYVSNSEGNLEFKEGVLVQALRKGHWIVLDELNLAPTDVLEALNRLLDDNRELLIPETQEIVKPHPHFMLFSTQNPPGLYGGRKVLSRAFRNRFIELHFDDLPQNELETILSKRCDTAPSYCKKIVAVYEELVRQRQSTRVFEQKHSFATLRDLFRWAEREAVGYEQLAANGYMLLAERVRKPDEKKVVKDVIEKVMKVPIEDKALYDVNESELPHGSATPVWTSAMKRLYMLVSRAIQHNEPILLVGETGCGKTTVCQVIAEALGKKLAIVNCHQNSETSDIIGAQRPIRDRAMTNEQLRLDLIAHLNADADLELDELVTLLAQQSSPDPALLARCARSRALFEWNDGPLVQAMRSGDFFLLDEISLADDSVLERLNSVLEPSRLLVLAEKTDEIGQDVEELRATNGFQFMATMNPGGDYGKKELSPALRNRFTEIWVDTISDRGDLLMILQDRLNPSLKKYAGRILEFSEWFRATTGYATVWTFSLRDLLAWTTFLNQSESFMNPAKAFYHGACLVLLDGLGMNSAFSTAKSVTQLQDEARNFIQEQMQEVFDLTALIVVSNEDQQLKIDDFSIRKGDKISSNLPFSLTAATTARNAMKVIRAMQLTKPILLEGSPGVGKTSLVTALADAAGFPLVRINLSEQTDLMDLFGSDLPVEDGKSGEFAWKDAPFLIAMQSGQWVLLDELNLASQSVLEGLNSCLDHRGTAYVPELDREFVRHENFRVFAAQNPLQQGGGRKGLPKSFVNRFTQVFMEELTNDDLIHICQHLYPSTDTNIIAKMIEFNRRLHVETTVRKTFGSQGAPWEFNLRDVLRWLEVLHHSSPLELHYPSEFVDLVYLQRFRSAEDRQKALQIFNEVFDEDMNILPHCYFDLNEDYIQIGHSMCSREQITDVSYQSLQLLQSQTRSLEAVMKSVELSWLTILNGASATGKTSLVRTLAEITGKKLEEFAMNSGVDTMELLGGFEQVELSRHAFTLQAELIILARRALDTQIRRGEDPSELAMILSLVDRGEQYEECLQRLEKFFDSTDLSRARQLLINLQRLQTSSVAGKFEWIDGVLLRAVEEGHWLLIDNANLCNPSVLDRLNSLFEPNGFLLINERGLVDGEVKRVYPHRDFRMFMTVNPKYGELSRAMRNRALEVSLVDPVSAVSTKEIPSKVLFDESTVSKIRIHGGSSPLAAENLLSHSSARELKTLQRWSFEASHFHPTSFTTYMSYLLDAFASDAVGQQFMNLDDANHWPIETAVNPYNSIDDTDIITAAFRIMFTSIRHSFLLDEVKASVGSKAIKYMTVVEQSVAHSRGIINKQKRPHPIMTAIGQLLLTIPALVSKGLASSDATVMHAFSLVQDFWYDLWEISQAPTVDFSRICVLFEHLEKLMAGSTVFSEIQNAIAPALSYVNLSTFASMRAMWSYMHPDVLSKPSALAMEQELLALQLQIIDSGHPWDSDFKPTLLQTMAFLHITGDDTSKAAPMSEDMRRLIDGFPKHEAVEQPKIMELTTNILDIASAHIDTQLQLDANLELLISSRDAAFRSSRTPSDLVPIQRLIWQREVGHNDQLDRRLEIEQTSNWLRFLFRPGREFDLSSVTVSQSKMQTNVYAYVNEIHETKLSDLADACRQADMIMETICSFNAAVDYVYMLRQKALDFGLLLIDSLERVFGDLHQQLRIAWKLGQSEFEQTLSQGNADSYFRGLLLKAFMFLRRSSNLHEAEQVRLAAVAEALIVLAQLSMKLYIPDVPFDPSIAEHVAEERIQAKHCRLTEEIQGRKALEIHFTGNETNNAIEYHEKQLSETPPTSSFTSAVPRPEASQLSQVFQHLQHMVQEVCDEAHVEALVRALQRHSQDGGTREAAFQDTTTQHLLRMQSAFPLYRDLTEPFHFALLHMKLGLRLLRDASSAQSRTNVLQMLIRTPTTILPVNDILPHLQNGRGMQKYLETLIVVAKRIVFEAQLNITNKQTAFEQFQAILGEMGSVWVEMEEKKAREEAEKDSLYKSRTKHVQMETEEELDAKELEEMFPDYDNDFDENADAVTKETTTNVEDVVIYDIARTHEALVKVIRGQSIDPPSNIYELEKLADSPDERSLQPSSYAVVISAASKGLKYLQGNDDSSSYDFYKSPNVSEVRKIIPILERMRERLRELAAIWPEQMVLDELAQLCSAILAFPLSTPVARALTGLELLLQRSEDWERSASKEVSLNAHRSDLTSLIVEWRRKELTSWSELLNVQDRISDEEVYKYWFHLQRSVLTVEETDEHIAKIVEVLDHFLQSSPRGQFAKRLGAVDIFAQHARVTMASKKVAQTATNVHRYYAQFLPQIQDSVASVRKPIEKDLKNFIKLASWKDINVHALRESARRTHRQLHKAIRKYRDALKFPVIELLRSMQSVATPLISFKGVSYTQPDQRSYALDSSLIISTSLSERPARLLDVLPTLHKIEKRIKTEVLGVKMWEYAPIMSEYSEDIVLLIKQFQQDTPNEITDENKSKIKNLKQLKKKALVDTLRDLQRLGLNPYPKPDVVKRQSDLTGYVFQLPVLSDACSVVDNDFYRIVRIMMKVREIPAQHSPDLSPVEVQRGVGFSENLLHWIISERQQLAGIASSITKIQQFSKWLQDLTISHQGVAAGDQAQLREDFDFARSVQIRIVASLREALDITGIQSRHANRRESQGLHQVAQSLQEAEKLRDDLCQHVHDGAALQTKHVRDTSKQQLAHLTSINAALKEVCDAEPVFAYAFNDLRDWIEEMSTESRRRNGPPQGSEETISIQDVDAAVCRLFDSILVTVQDVRQHTLVDMEETSGEDLPDRLFSNLFERYRDIVAKLHLPSIEDTIAKTMDVIALHLRSSTADSPAVDALLTQVMAFIATYDHLVSQIFERYLEHHVHLVRFSLTAMSIFASLAANGYCQPAGMDDDEEGSGDEEGNLQAGGLGDGEGAKDISNKIEDEDEAIGNEGQDASTEKDDTKEEAKGIEMEQDFDSSKLEDYDAPENDENGEEEDDDERQEPEDQVGPIDDLDPDAVDEKLWGDDSAEQQEDNEKKLDEDRSTQQNGESEMVAKDDEEQKPDKNQSGENVQETADEEMQEIENQQNADEEDDVGADEEEAEHANDAGQKMDVPDTEALDLPDELNLEGSDDEASADQGDARDDFGDDLDMEEADKHQERGEEGAFDVGSNGGDEDGDDEQRDETNHLVEKPEDAQTSTQDDASEHEDAADHMQSEDKQAQCDPHAEQHQGQGETSNVAEDQETQTETKTGGTESQQGVELPEKHADNALGEEDEEMNAPAMQEAEQRPHGSNGTGQQSKGADSSRKPEERTDINPLTDFDAAMEQWQRRLKELLSPNDDTELNESQQQVREDAEFEYSRGDADAQDELALAPTADTSSQKPQDTRVVDEDADENGDDVAMEDAPETEPAEHEIDHEGGDDVRGTREGFSDALIGRQTEVDEDMEMHLADAAQGELRKEQQDSAMEDLREPVESLHLAADEAHADGAGLWQKYERQTHDLSLQLTEQLRLILEPTLATRLRGDYRTGKRLNMKKIIPYIASEFKKDKIWLRRTKPSKRQYQVMIALDDSRSMAESGSVPLAYETLALVSKALTLLEVGEISIVGFGEDVSVMHPFEKPFSDRAGAEVMDKFAFSSTKTDVRKLVETSLGLFMDARQNMRGGNTEALWQLQLIISDGICENHAALQALLRRAYEEQVMFVFIVVDSLGKSGGSDSGNSILTMNRASYQRVDGKLSLKMERYLDTFPFQYHVVVRDVRGLPEVLSTVLREWFSQIRDV